jgi:hypothetical protein
MIGEVVETSASFEARYAPPPYPTTGMKQRMKVPYEKGVAIRSASSLALGIARYTAKRRQRIGGVGIQLRKLSIRTPTPL